MLNQGIVSKFHWILSEFKRINGFRMILGWIEVNLFELEAKLGDDHEQI